MVEAIFKLEQIDSSPYFNYGGNGQVCEECKDVY